MALFKSGNPTLTDKLFSGAMPVSQTETMTERGTMYKFGMMMLLLFVFVAKFLFKNEILKKFLSSY